MNPPRIVGGLSALGREVISERGRHPRSQKRFRGVRIEGMTTHGAPGRSGSVGVRDFRRAQ
jgi:hypothetical protein